jgi:hypothetical protein
MMIMVMTTTTTTIMVIATDSYREDKNTADSAVFFCIAFCAVDGETCITDFR